MNHEIPLNELLAPWVVDEEKVLDTILVKHLEIDSRKVTQGSTFVAVIGHQVDGRTFIDKALSQGASAVIAESCALQSHGTVAWRGSVPIVYVADLGQRLSHLAARLYQHGEMKLIGVTGTNGKTTITQIIAQWIERVGQRAAVMGTAGNGFLEQLTEAENTTGSAIEIKRTLAELAQAGAEYTALEVSSHGLIQGRIKSLPFAASVFTNLSRDHLDYHGTMDAYAQAKLTLFTEHNTEHAIINSDDEVGATWLQQLPQAVAVSLKSPVSGHKSLYATNVTYSEQGITIAFDGHWGAGELNAPLIGEFNASNLLVALATLLSLGFEKQQLVNAASELQPVIGRMELFRSHGRAGVVVDYAHTPDALEKALSALRVHCRGKLWAIFGCGGDRDTGKRPMMAEIAERLADKIILTDDNPRSESPQAIVNDMLAGLSFADKAHVEHDRFAAASFALAQAGSEDIVLLAGKGHEDYQVFLDGKVHYSDRETAAKLLGMTL